MRLAATLVATLATATALTGRAQEAPETVQATAPAAYTHHITATLDPAAGRLQVVDRIQVAGRRDYAFVLAPGLRLVEVTVDGTRAELPGTSPGGYRLPLEPATRELEIAVAGTLPPPRGQRGALGPDHPVMGPEGSYLPGGWLPWPRGETASYRLAVAVPLDQRVVAEGRRLAETREAGQWRGVFASRRAAPAPALFAGPWAVDQGPSHGGVIPLRSYFYPEHRPLAASYFRAAGDFLARYSRAIGPYPFDEFRIVAAPLPVGLGFRGLTYVSRQIVPLPYMRGRSLAHEILHNWWGNGVYIDYARGNWGEGLTTYQADHALAEDQSPAVARQLRIDWLADFAALPADRDRPLVDFTVRHHRAAQIVGYGKGALVFHMLRRRLGEAAFTEALQDFWRTWQFRTATWEDLQRAFEGASGEDLEVFFRQWLTRPGAPQLALVDASTTAVDGGFEVHLTLAQTQDAEPYMLEIPVVVETPEGPETQWVTLHGPRREVVVPVTSPPLAVAVDPDFDLFRRLLPAERPLTLRDVWLAEDAQLAVVADEGAHRLAFALARRLRDEPTAAVDLQALDPQRGALIIAVGDGLAEVLATLDIAIPPPLAAPGSRARVWTTTPAAGGAVAIVAAADVQALAQLAGPLPHYGRQSYLWFGEGTRARVRGVWGVGDNPLRRRLSRADP